MNCIEPVAKFANASCEPVAEIRSEMRKMRGNPVCQRFSLPANHTRSGSHHCHQCDKNKSPQPETLVEQNFPCRGSEENRGYQNQREGSYIKNSLHCPHRKLRRKTQLNFAGNQIRTNEFSWPA